MAVSKIEINDKNMRADEEDAKKSQKLVDDAIEAGDEELTKRRKLMLVPQDGKAVVKQMITVQDHIKKGAKQFLKEEYTKLAIFCLFFAAILVVAVDQVWKENEAGDKIPFPMTTFAFLVGASTSMLCGYIGMVVATDANAKTTSETAEGIEKGFNVAFKGG